VEGVYTQSRWEYPVKALREVIRNAIVHRDYSLAGKDIKVAIYDDMVEVTSPGLLPPSLITMLWKIASRMPETG